MDTTIDEISADIYRIATFVPDVGLSFNQILVVDDEPLLFHLGMRGLFPAVQEAVTSVLPLDRLRWLSFGHVEADECGAMNQWLAAAPHADVVFGGLNFALEKEVELAADVAFSHDDFTGEKLGLR